MTVSGVTDSDSIQVGFLAVRKLAQREKVRKLVGSAVSTEHKWSSDAFIYVTVTKQMNIKCLQIATLKRNRISSNLG